MQAEVVRRYLEADGHGVTLAADGRTALDLTRRLRPDLVVLDVMMPGTDGLDVCRLLRRESDVPVLMLTARSTEDDLLLGLEVGADDYLTKPYSPRELTARVRTLLRRVVRRPAPRPGADQDGVLRVGPLRVDPARREVRMGDRAVECTPDEFAILSALAAHPGRVFSREVLLERTSGHDRFSSPRAIDVHVRNLRRKIEPAPSRPVHLLTVFGVGYKFSGGPGHGR